MLICKQTDGCLFTQVSLELGDVVFAVGADDTAHLCELHFDHIQ